MKSTFIFGFVLGLFGLLVGAYFAPWASYERVASKTKVAMNGGREESFVIRLPDDRIAAAGLGVLNVDPNVGVALPTDLPGEGFLGEQFKLRDADGTVIGVAARHWTMSERGPATTWALSIPSRGTVVLAANDTGPSRVWQALEGAGYREGSAWSGEIVVEVAGTETSTRVPAGTDEFAATEGRYEESWTLTGVSDAGELRGTVLIRTTVNSKT